MNKLKQLKYLWLAIVAVAAVSTAHTSFAGMSIYAYGNFSGLGEAITGTDVEDLYAAGAFPDAPDITDYASSVPGLSSLIVDGTSGRFEWPQPTAAGNSGIDNHGMIFQGIFIAPVDGTYQFFIRSDDGSAIYLTDEPMDLIDLVDEEDRPAPDAIETGCCGGFGKAGTVTDTMELSAGQGKFITLALKEGGGGDWQQVGISVNGGPVEVLSLGHVQRYEYSDAAPAQEDLFIVGYGPDGVRDEFSIEVNEADTANVYVEFDAEISNQDDIPDITWKVDGKVVEGAKGSQLSFVPVADVNEFQVVRTVTAEVDGFGDISYEVFVNRDDNKPSLVGAAGSGNPKGILVTFSELVDPDSATNPDNYEISGQDIAIDSVEMVGGNSVILKTSSDFTTDEILVSVSGVTDRAIAKNEMDADLKVVSITTNLLAYWPFNDDGNTEVAIDVAGGVAGEIRDAAYTPDGEGASGESGDFGMDFGSDNAGQHIFVEDASFLNASEASNQMSVSFWQKNYATGNSSSYWMFAPGVNGSSRGNQAHVPWGNQQIYFDTEGCCNGGNERINRNINQFEDFYDDFYLDWHHYTFVKNGDQKEIWVDGKLFHSGTNREDFSGRFASMTIGSATNGGNSSQAVMDDFAVFAVGLSEEQIGELADGGSPLDLAVPLSQPLELVSDIAGGEAEERKPFTVGIEVSGGPAFTIGYQWYLNGEPMLGETTSSISWELIPKSEDGNKYRVEAFNTDGTYNLIQSTEVTISVSDDTEAPVLTDVSGSPFNNQVNLTFDEHVDSEQLSASDFVLTAVEGGTGTVDVNDAVVGANPNEVILSTDAQDDGVRYEVTVKSVFDLAANQNEATDIKGRFLSWAKQVGGATALLYTNKPGSNLNGFPVETRGTGEFPSDYRPFRIGSPNWENINQGYSSIINYFESPNSGNINTTRVNARDNYGQIVTGWLKPSESGRYLIAIAVDDNAELYLSSDDTPDNAQLVASEPQWNGNRQYDDGKEDNWTEILDLEAGEEYYFELYMSEGGGGDNIAVAWSYTTDGSDPAVPSNGSNPIPGDNLVTYMPVFDELSIVSVSPASMSLGATVGDPITLVVSDGFTEKVNSDSFVGKLNGEDVDVNVTQEDGVTTATIATDGLSPVTKNTAMMSFESSTGETYSQELEFITGGKPEAREGTYVSANGLINYWSFDDEDADDEAGDLDGNSSENDDNGTIGDDITFESEEVEGNGMFALFPGSDDTLGTIRFPNSADIDLGGRSLTISTWVKVTEFTTNWQAIIAQGEQGGYRLHRWGGNNGFAFKGGGGEPRGGDIADGEWHHIVAVAKTFDEFVGLEEPKTIIYLDGVEVDRANTGADIEHQAHQWDDGLMIGGNPEGGGRAWNGGIDEVAMWARPLTLDEIAILAAGGSIKDASDQPPVADRFDPSSVVEPEEAEITGATSDGGNITFSYTGKLQSAPSAAGPWSDVEGASSPFSEAMSDSAKFYRVISE